MKEKSSSDQSLSKTFETLPTGVVGNMDANTISAANMANVEKKYALFQKRNASLLIRPCMLGDTSKSGSLPNAQKLDYNLKEKIGQGAYGLVFSANQNTIDREIAIKLLRPEMVENPGVKSLFLSEAVVTGDLDHPNIVPIYDLGVDQQNRLFYTMKKINGTSWSQVIDQRSEAENIDILLRVCDAIAFAHDKGVIHRDLKPQNIMIGNYGEVFVMDWGIAISPSGKGKAEILTPETNQAGTPLYMAPEMADTKASKVTHLSDIYLLGGILYQIETGLTPHSAGSLIECIKKVIKNEIQPTEKKSELIDIALKAMSTDPADRYQSVAEFSQAVRDYQDHAQSIALCKSGMTNHEKAKQTRIYDDYLLALFSYKNALAIWPNNHQANQAIAEVGLDYARCAYENEDYDLAISLLDSRYKEHQKLLTDVLKAKKQRQSHQRHIKWLKFGSITLAISIFVIVSAGLVVVKTQKDRAVLAEKKMRIAQKKAVQENYYNAIALTSRKLDDQLFEQAQTLLNKLPKDLRGWEWGRLMRRCKLDLMTFKGHDQALEAVAFSPDEKFVATASKDNTIRIWDMGTGKQVKTFSDFSGKIQDLKYDPNGRTLFALNTDGLMMSWGIDNGIMTRVEYNGNDDELYMFYSPNKKYYIKRTLQQTAQIFSTKKNEPVCRLIGHTDAIYTASFSPDNTKVVTGSADKTAIIWDVQTGKPINILTGHNGSIQSVKFSPSGKYILTGSTDKTAKLWSVESNRDKKVLLGHKSFVNCVTFSPDNRKLATTSYDASVKIWDIATQKLERTLLEHNRAVYAAKFSKDGQYLITGGADNMAIVWKAGTGEVVTFLRGHTHSIMAVDFSPDGQFAATASWDRTIKIWNLSTSQVVMTLTGHQNAVISIMYAPDGKTIVSGSKDHTARVWDVTTGKVIHMLRGHGASVYSVVFSNDGRFIATASWDKTVRLWNSENGQLIKTLKGHTSSVYSVAFTPDGNRLISAGWDKAIKVWDVRSGQELMSLFGHTAPIYSVAVSPNGIMVATGGRDKSAIIWEAEPYDQ